jgi:hypothetical protein
MNALLEQLDSNGMPLNAIRNNLTGALMQIQSRGAPAVSLDYSRPMIQLADGRKGYYGKNDPMNVYDAEGNKLSTLIADVSSHNAAQDRAYQLQKRQMDLDTERLQQQRIQQEIDGVGRAPAGYRYVQGGGMEPIPGGPADMKAQGKFNQDIASMNATEAAMNELAQQANAIKEHGGLDAAVGWQSMFPTMPGSKAANAEALLETLRSKTAFGTLQAMRDASKTGGALGAVSEKELKLLESNLAALSKAQSPEQFRQQLDAVVKYAEGAKGRTREAFNMTHNGRVTPQQQGYSADDLMHTAQKHGISVEEVKRRLGVQ